MCVCVHMWHNLWSCSVFRYTQPAATAAVIAASAPNVSLHDCRMKKKKNTPKGKGVFDCERLTPKPVIYPGNLCVNTFLALSRLIAQKMNATSHRWFGLE